MNMDYLILEIDAVLSMRGCYYFVARNGLQALVLKMVNATELP